MSRFMTTGQDWDTVTLNKKPAPKSGAALRIAPGDARFVSRGGPHVSSGGRTLNQQHTTGSMNHKKLDEDNETLKHKMVSRDFQITLMQARMTKGWNQKELALKCQERETIIKEYENGKAIPNNQVIQKMERALGIHLKGKEAGKPIVRPEKKEKKAAAKPGGKKSK